MKIQKLTNNRLYYSEDEFYRVNINYFKNDIKEGIKKYNKLTRRNCV